MAARAGIGRIIEHLGSTLLDLVAGDAEGPRADSGVGAVVIHDPLDEQPLPPRALVLGVGVRGADDIATLLRDLSAHDGAGLVVRSPVAVDDTVRQVASETGTLVFGLTRGASWNQLAALLRELLGGSGIGDPGSSGATAGGEPETLAGVPAGDLFALANAIGALLDAPVTIEDRSSRLLAFSGRQDEADEPRIETVLGRQVPERYLRRLEQLGVFRRLYASDRPVFTSADDIGHGVTLGRAAVAVRAGDELLGSIWAVLPDELSPDREQALVDAAKLVALHLLRVRAGADVGRRLVADLVATALEGGAGAVEALGRLGLADRPLVVLALGLPDETDGRESHSMARRETERQRVTDALSIHLSALHPGSVVASVGGVAYGILPVSEASEDAEERAVRVASEFLSRTSTGPQAHVGVGRAAPDVSRLARARTDADRALRVLRQGAGQRRVARVSDVQVESLLLQLGDLAAAEGAEPTGPIARLRAYDTEHRSQLTATLSAWLDSAGDVGAAAAQVHVHVNTFRYRLRRIGEIGGIDLDDADSRFAAMLQLRLLRD
ncbi:PucR family transcriptional regulator [Terracoccus luteus]|uniref:DNA-binding PucR family transcriptional regulator n=1 Tax=Terracoccus luteus TaxID=53356 RepID=A0A839PT42_9MICO|nr:helix-turn-helix domain-containing protein [Terracoccus luteus]MBB2986687.1 DNA-binding PucR family transcriptional regulator [Terracoccus luteus]MCP2172338.1 DNA-binding PucR family transcriptional regulator [Terracoccus luteus]